MPTAHPLTIRGAHGSPYSLKMRAVLRYRRIPFRWVLRGSVHDDLPPVPVQIIPAIAFPAADGSHGDVMVDSSPQIMALEDRHRGRSVVPADPALAFVDALIEDVADEWLTKAMYHYRWAFPDDIEKAGRLLPLSQSLQATDEQLEQAHDFIIERQLARRAMVGSTDANAPILESSFIRLLDLMQRHLGTADFLLGDRPGRGDFALFGQLSQLLGFDPTPMALGVAHAPRLMHWVDQVDDLSGLPVEEGHGWNELTDLADTTIEFLQEAGRTYAPFMVANAAALADGADEMVCEIDGREYRQAPFGYQAKCLGWLRDDHAALTPEARSSVDELLAGTGCEILFT